jgi:hypothetical protein
MQDGIHDVGSSQMVQDGTPWIIQSKGVCDSNPSDLFRSPYDEELRDRCRKCIINVPPCNLNKMCPSWDNVLSEK